MAGHKSWEMKENENNAKRQGAEGGIPHVDLMVIHLPGLDYTPLPYTFHHFPFPPS